MEYRVLYRKYRPKDFDSLVGQDYTKKLLKNSIINDKISHAYIFTGPRGTGKTSSAKIFAKAINCLHPVDGNPCNECEMCRNFKENPDIIEIDAASNNGVDEIREIINNVRLAPSQSKYKVYIIDEFHMLSMSAFNALLLTLEEPPQNVVFILATTDIQSVPITVISRCQRFDFKPISIENIVARLRFVCDEEQINITESALEEIAYMSNGGMRDALSILDQISSKESEIDVEDITNNFGSISNKKIREVIKAYNEGLVDKVLELLSDFENNGIDAKILIEKLVDELKNILIKIKKDEYMGNLDFDDTFNLILELNSVLTEMKSSINPYNFIEIIILKYIKVANNHKELKKELKAIEPQEEKTSTESINKLEEVKDDQVNNQVEVAKAETKSSNTNLIMQSLSFNIDVRINNCFVGAKKSFLSVIKDKWDDFVIYESNANKALLSYIADTDVVAASNDYAILVNSIDSTNDLINQNIASLENDFRIFYGNSYKLVSISNQRWQREREKYIKNIKSGYTYTMIDDNIILGENTSELEKLASEIFGDNVKIIEEE